MVPGNPRRTVYLKPEECVLIPQGTARLRESATLLARLEPAGPPATGSFCLFGEGDLVSLAEDLLLGERGRALDVRGAG